MKLLLKYSLVIWLLLLTSNSHAQVLIVHPNNTSPELSRNTLRAIFAMRTHYWDNGTAIKVFVLEDNNPDHVSFCKDLLSMLPYQLRRIWDRQVFSGTGVAPITVKSIDEMLVSIAENSGAIGYIDDELVNDHVKLLGKQQ